MIQKQANIQDYIQVIIRRRGVILTFFTVLFFTVLIGTLKQKPIYADRKVEPSCHLDPGSRPDGSR